MNHSEAVVYGLRLTTETKVRYVGITINGADRRLRTHLNAALRDSQYLVHRWIRKQEPDSVVVDTIEVVDRVEDLCEREKYWIKKLATHVSEQKGGLNCTWGGEFTSAWDSLTPEQKERSRQHLRKMQKKQWSDPIIRARRSAQQSAIFSDLWKTQEFRDASIERLKARHKDPEFAEATRKRSSDRMKRLHQDPEFAARRDARTRAMHRDPAYQERMKEPRRRAAHTTWHVRRGIIHPSCEYCARAT